MCCALEIFAVAEFASVGYLYPALLTLLVPFRAYILDRCFRQDDLRHLDPADETETEFHDEQRLVHRAFHDDCSVDEEELAFPTRAEFRGQGLKRALMNTNRRHTIGHGDSDDILHMEVAKACIDAGLRRSGRDRNFGHGGMDLLTTVKKPSDPKLKASASITNLKELNRQDPDKADNKLNK
jgi:GNAT superfamily N-acetyltransferase